MLSNLKWRSFLAVFSSFFLFSACLTRAPVSALPEITKQAADLLITLRPLDYDTLKERHGGNRDNKVNPFIDFPGQVPQRRIVVFEADFRSEESIIMIELRQIKLEIDGNSGPAASAEYLNRLWDVYIRKTAYMTTIPSKTRQTMLPRHITIKPGEPVSGYLVFAEPYPKEGGNALLEIPVETDQGDHGTIEITMNFNEGGITREHRKKNTGIFSESTESELSP